MLKAIDTETTGVDLFHGCKPFFVSITKEDGTVLGWEFDVDPTNRKPILDTKQAKKQLDSLYSEITNPADELVFHNTTFDLFALGTLYPDLDFDNLLSRSHDTLLMSHVWNSREDHGLKELALKYLNINTRDQKKLQKLVNECRSQSRPLKWAIASKEACPYVRRAPSGENGEQGWWVMDMWLPKALAVQKALPPSHPYWSVCGTYCHTDTLRTLGLYIFFQEGLTQDGLWHKYQEQRATLPSIFWMMKRGVSLNKPVMEKKLIDFLQLAEQQELNAKRLHFRYRTDSSPGRKIVIPPFNLRSYPQMAELLYTHMGLPVLNRNKKTDNPKTDGKTLIELVKTRKIISGSTEFEFVSSVIVNKKAAKCADYLQQYRTKLLDSRLHPRFNLTGTKTTRLSSSEPNGQNVSKGSDALLKKYGILGDEYDLSLRSVFGPHKGREWWSCDYKQLQLVIFAYVSGDRRMIEAVEAGYDFHDFVARTIFNLSDSQEPTEDQRRIGKNCNFGFVFGAQPKKIEETAQMSGLWDILCSAFPGATGYMESTIKQVKRNGFVTLPSRDRNLKGYRLYVPKDKAYSGVNYIVQGTEGEIVKLAMRRCHGYLQHYLMPLDYATTSLPAGFLTLQVHDELVFDFKRDLGIRHMPALIEQMEKSGKDYGLGVCKVDSKFISQFWNKGIKFDEYSRGRTASKSIDINRTSSPTDKSKPKTRRTRIPEKVE